MKNKKFLLLIPVLLIIVAAVAWVLLNRPASGPELALSEMALPVSSLPGDPTQNSGEALTINRSNHPLNAQNSSLLMTEPWQEGYGMDAYDESGRYIMAQFLYRYDDHDSAQAQAGALLEGFERDVTNGGVTPTISRSFSERFGVLPGQNITFIEPDDGWRVSWYIGVHNRTLVALMVMGPEDDEARSAFETIKYLQQDHIRKQM